jgi:hypothetical protein
MLMSVRPLVVTKAPNSASETSAADPMAKPVTQAPKQNKQWTQK